MLFKHTFSKECRLRDGISTYPRTAQDWWRLSADVSEASSRQLEPRRGNSVNRDESLRYDRVELLSRQEMVVTGIPNNACLCFKKKSKKSKEITLDTPPLSEVTSLQKRSHALSEDFTVLPAPPRVYPRMKWALPAFVFPSEAASWSSFTDPGGMGGWDGLGTTDVSKQSKTATWRLSQLLAAQAVTPHWKTGSQGSVELTTSRAASRDANH